MPSVIDFIDKLSRSLYLDYSRKQFAIHTYETLASMVEGPKNDTGFRRMLLGRKGVGKTFLLKTLQVVAEAEFTRGPFARCVMPFYLDYLNCDQLPTEVIWWKISKHPQFAGCGPSQTPGFPSWERVAELESFFIKNNIIAFIVVDELQEVYQEGCKNGKEIIGQLAQIGALGDTAMHCVLTGSSTHLRELVLAKLPQEYCSKFPNYCSKDLNSTKFKPRWIYPFLNAIDFKKYVAIVSEKYHKPAPKDLREYDLLITSGGNARCIYDAISHNTCNQDYTATKRKRTEQENQFLTVLFNVIKLRRPETPPPISPMDSPTPSPALHTTPAGDTSAETFSPDIFTLDEWVRMIPFTAVHELYDSRDEQVVYSLVDSGVIRFDDSVLPAKIGFGSHCIYVELAAQNGLAIILSEQDLFTIHNFTSDAEAVAFRLFSRVELSHWAKDFGTTCSLPNLWQDKVFAPLNLDAPSKLESASFYHLWKESRSGKGNAGGDGLVLTEKNNQVYAHRIQLKLGTRNLADVSSIIRQFKTHLGAVQQRLDYLLDTKVTQHLYLATTCSIPPESKLKLQQADIAVLDARFMTAHVWPENVKWLGKPFC